MNIIQFLAKERLTISMSEGRRLVCCGIVKINGQPESDMSRELQNGDLIECRGKEFTYRVE